MRIEIDTERCQGFGLCVETIPDVLRLDEWGNAELVETGGVPEHLEHLARRAISECPVGAILEASATQT